MPKTGMAGSSILMVPWLDALKVAVDLGFDAFELFAEFPQTDMDDIPREMIDEAHKVLDESGIELCVHAPFNSLNIAAFNNGIRAESVRQYIQAVDLCADLGGQVVVAHTGQYIVYKNITRHDDPGMNLQWEYNIESLKKVTEHAAKRGVTICLENIAFEQHQIDQSLTDLVEIREAVGNPSMMYCMDIGHARLSEGVDKVIEVLSPDIRHIHFTDNRGEYDDHMVIGRGNFDYSGITDFIREFPYIVTLEVVKIGEDTKYARISKEYFDNNVLGK